MQTLLLLLVVFHSFFLFHFPFDWLTYPPKFSLAYPRKHIPSRPLDNIRVVVIVWRIIRTALLDCVTQCSQYSSMMLSTTEAVAVVATLSQKVCTCVWGLVGALQPIPATSGDIINTIEQLDLKNMGIAVGILSLAVLCAEIVLLTVRAAAISISGTTRLPVVLAATSLNRATWKIWMQALEFRFKLSCLLR